MLEVGKNVNFRGLGAGSVIEHTERRFAGENRTFAVIFFPHSQMRAQVPLDDADVLEKISPVLAESTLRKILRGFPRSGSVLPRTWDAREEMGQKALREGGPKEWGNLLASYARAEGAGVSVAASDEELVRSAAESFAAELSCAAGMDYLEALRCVDDYYEKAVDAGRSDEPAEHFAAVEAP